MSSNVAPFPPTDMQIQFFAGHDQGGKSNPHAAPGRGGDVVKLLESALIGVGTITVAGPELEAAAADRICRARSLAVALSERFFGMRSLEVWRFEIDAALTPAAPQLYVAPLQCSRAPSCSRGGARCTATDFGVLSRNVSRNVSKRIRTRQPGGAVVWRTVNSTRHSVIRYAPPMPRALNWGYYYEGDPWQRWARIV
jgi:hypothetical protein